MKKVYSVVWQFFDRLEENNRCVAVFCKLCDTKYKYVGNTTNLRGHLIRKHPLHWELGQNKKIIDSLNSSSTVSQRRWKYSSSRDENVGLLEISDTDEHVQGPDILAPKRKKTRCTIKREVVTPPRRLSNYYRHTNTKGEKQQVILEKNRKDEFSAFGEYIANKLRSFKSPRTQGNIQQIITTILWQGEYGLYDDADAVKRIFLSSVMGIESEQSIQPQTHDAESVI